MASKAKQDVDQNNDSRQGEDDFGDFIKWSRKRAVPD